MGTDSDQSDSNSDLPQITQMAQMPISLRALTVVATFPDWCIRTAISEDDVSLRASFVGRSGNR
jgi:hypothetical protein